MADNNVRRNPWWFQEGDDEEIDALRRQVSQWMSQPFGWNRRLQRRSGFDRAEWTPHVDLFDRGDHLTLKAELAGVEEGDIEVTLHNGILTIQGERKPDQEIAEDAWYCCERRVGRFFRAIQLPVEVDANAIEARYTNGLLTLTLPKIPEILPKKVQIHIK